MYRNYVIKKIDDLGRLSLPREYRKALALGKAREVCLHMDGKKLIIESTIPICCICGQEDNLIVFTHGYICTNCTESLKKL